MQLTVVHVDGSKRGQTETFTQPIVAVGRDPSNQLAFDPFKDTDVSSRHAQFVFQGSQLMVQDLGSRNGTFVNGQKIGPQPVPVADGAVVQFGDKGPKIQLSVKTEQAGPGKKTQMITDLKGKLEAVEKQAAAAKPGMASKVLPCLLVLLMGAAGAGFFGWQTLQKRKADQRALDVVLADLPAVRKAAEDAHADLSVGQKWEKQGDEAQKAGSFAEAAGFYNAAIGAYKESKSLAKEAAITNQLAELMKANEELTRKSNEKKGEQQQQDVERSKELDQKKADEARAQEAQVAKLKADLEAAKTVAAMGPIIDAALASTKEAPVQSALDKVKDEATKAPSDQLTKWQAALQARLDDLKAIPVKLDKAALDAKLRIVAIQATSYALPKSQNENTTQIREFITSASGTGFFVTKDKIVTAKELVEPWKFDPAALALRKKWDELGYKVNTRVDILTLDVAGVYTTTATTNFEQPTASITYVGADAAVDSPVDQKVTFKGAESTVQVSPNRRDASNIAVIQLKAGTATPIGLARDDALKAGDLAVVLGQKAGGPDVKTPDQSRLYSQQAECTQAGATGVLGTGGYATWTGGPVLNADGQCEGVVIDVQKDAMRLLSPARIREAAGLN